MNRRSFLQTLGSLTTLPIGLHAEDSPRSQPPQRTKAPQKKLAVVTSVYKYLSHSYHICGRFLNGYLLPDGQYHFPSSGIASCYVDQIPAEDLSGDLSKKHQFRRAKTIEEALTLGTGQLAVDGVLLICEHGEYPYNGKQQKLYPRYEMFQKIVEVFRKSGRSVPVFCDKHLSYDRHKAAKMVATSAELKFPMLAGSSLPVTWRRPELDLPLGTKMEEALVASRGELEIYGIHALEALQCMVERRFSSPAETPPNQGVRKVQCLVGDAVWKAGDAGQWSWKLLEAALSRSSSRNNGDIKENCQQWMKTGLRNKDLNQSPVVFLIEYNDGLKATILQLDGHVADETFAAKLAGQEKPVSTLFWLPPPPGAAFLEALAIQVEKFMDTGKPTYPVQRTQLTGSILDYALESRSKAGQVQKVEDLNIAYYPPEDSGFMRGDYAR
ncbi:hypothetical protein KIH39_20870 [Telmatocola sphagniphila]|uniref:Uncharacterized protein n=1 Tax=Telmatocola sphagniphila TaxID=1123043 RepID=A0A8E6B327_9BACT|nr:hypothetical protein [Telmatocola sphagniphila]QVL31275.1 hypothetical protein KIH39_20870 [Telmatocola sphagniphila]